MRVHQVEEFNNLGSDELFRGPFSPRLLKKMLRKTDFLLESAVHVIDTQALSKNGVE
jgi:23S rRNA A2030 N6-methylase RlmJ